MLQTIILLESTAQSLLKRRSHFHPNIIRRHGASLTPRKITQILRKDECIIDKSFLPNYVKSIECNQLASNHPIEDRIRVSSMQIPGCQDPTIFLGVFDGHGGGTTVDLISRRLFNYIALSLHPEKLDLHDLHHSPAPKHDPSLRPYELDSLQSFRNEIQHCDDVIENIKASFKRCDEDLSNEIQRELTSSQRSDAALHYYLSAALSGCCAMVMILHQGVSYLASVGDCRAVSGTFKASINDTEESSDADLTKGFSATELIDEHNCYNVNEIRRLASAHPISEQNTIVKNNRLLGQLMPFRAFGDFNYKWTSELIHRSGLTKYFGGNVIAPNYNTPPYLIAEPEIKEIALNRSISNGSGKQDCFVIATDGLWEMFESSRDVIETIALHSMEINRTKQCQDDDIDQNSATHVIRNALGSESQNMNCTLDRDEIRRMQHSRLETTLTLPKSISRNFRDDISILVLKLDQI